TGGRGAPTLFQDQSNRHGLSGFRRAHGRGEGPVEPAAGAVKRERRSIVFTTSSPETSCVSHRTAHTCTSGVGAYRRRSRINLLHVQPPPPALPERPGAGRPHPETALVSFLSREIRRRQHRPAHGRDAIRDQAGCFTLGAHAYDPHPPSCTRPGGDSSGPLAS